VSTELIPTPPRFLRSTVRFRRSCEFSVSRLFPQSWVIRGPPPSFLPILPPPPFYSPLPRDGSPLLPVAAQMFPSSACHVLCCLFFPPFSPCFLSAVAFSSRHPLFHTLSSVVLSPRFYSLRPLRSHVADPPVLVVPFFLLSRGSVAALSR